MTTKPNRAARSLVLVFTLLPLGCKREAASDTQPTVEVAPGNSLSSPVLAARDAGVKEVDTLPSSSIDGAARGAQIVKEASEVFKELERLSSGKVKTVKEATAILEKAVADPKTRDIDLGILFRGVQSSLTSAQMQAQLQTLPAEARQALASLTKKIDPNPFTFKDLVRLSRQLDAAFSKVSAETLAPEIKGTIDSNCMGPIRQIAPEILRSHNSRGIHARDELIDTLLNLLNRCTQKLGAP
jgi:hypothetical protein